MRRLALLGGLSVIPYAFAFYLQDLRAHTVEFESAFFAAFVLYAIAVVFVLRQDNTQYATRNTLFFHHLFGFFRLLAALIRVEDALADAI